MKTLYVYESRRKLKDGMQNLYSKMPKAEKYPNKLYYAGNTFYFRSVDNWDQIRGLQYKTWHKMGRWNDDLETWQRDTLDANCRGGI